MLKTNLVPLVTLSVTIMRFFRDGLRRRRRRRRRRRKVVHK